MRKALFISALALAALTVSGCDFFRSLAGKPTSDWIAEKAERIKQTESLLDSLTDAISDAIAVRDSIAAKKAMEELKAIESAVESGTMAPSDTVASPDVPESDAPSESAAPAAPDAVVPESATLEYRYYIVVGVFSSPENARKLADRAESKGYEAVLMAWRGGKTAVALCPTNDLATAYSSVDNLSRESFCPKDVWIMDSNRDKI